MVTREIAWEQQQVDPATGLFQVDKTTGFDWDADPHSGEGTANTALHFDSLNAAAEMADSLGDAPNAQLWGGRADATKAAVNVQLWNPAMGAYDAFTNQRGVVVQDANVWAVQYGIASADQASQIVKTLAERLSTLYGLGIAEPNATGYTQKVSPFIGYFTLKADYAANRTDLAMEN
jgi:glycogen debranching enzyme